MPQISASLMNPDHSTHASVCPKTDTRRKELFRLDQGKACDEIVKISDYLQSMYGKKYVNVLAWHTLVGSTPDHEIIPIHREDFPEPDSIPLLLDHAIIRVWKEKVAEMCNLIPGFRIHIPEHGSAETYQDLYCKALQKFSASI